MRLGESVEFEGRAVEVFEESGVRVVGMGLEVEIEMEPVEQAG